MGWESGVVNLGKILVSRFSRLFSPFLLLFPFSFPPHSSCILSFFSESQVLRWNALQREYQSSAQDLVRARCLSHASALLEADESCPLSLDNEIASLQDLARHLESLLLSLPTSLDHDLGLLARSSGVSSSAGASSNETYLSEHQRLAVMIRAGHKRPLAPVIGLSKIFALYEEAEAATFAAICI